MADSPLDIWFDRSGIREDRTEPYLCLHFVSIYVRDQERSLRFFVDQLGFIVAVDQTFDFGTRWVEVTPPYGTANLALVVPRPGSEEYKRIGQSHDIFFLTEDVVAKFEEWSKHGVHFTRPPQSPPWGGIYARFEDIDGNSFGLAGFDEFQRGIEAQRRSAVEKKEAERRAAQELEIATQIQARLFPQMHPEVRGLEYCGACIQAHQVGGDYYDFLDLGRDRLGLVIGDISGKGIGAALLMANLQANLRGQSAIASSDPERFLRAANRLFYDNTPISAFASLFFAAYDGDQKSLTYVNCGHLPGLILQKGSSVERLASSCTLLGLFDDLACNRSECTLQPGDLLALYTDGVTEAFNDREEEFGEERLIEVLDRRRDLPATALAAAVVDEVRRFSPQEQSDDITLIVAKCKE
jgi:serine phosphatase RsbU (regulator of sigma subunit)/catechol 2,3-dioxygenase-like lactoylglutathione lyase family enzyme